MLCTLLLPVYTLWYTLIIPVMRILQFPPRCEGCGSKSAHTWHWTCTDRHPTPRTLCWECNMKEAQRQRLSVFQKMRLMEELQGRDE